VISDGLKYSVLRDDNNLAATLQMLATDKNVNILSTPHILTLNNQPAVIRVGEEVPVLTETRNIQGGETIRSYDYKSVAVELDVTPRINEEREVFLKVHPLVKKILGFDAELNAPILATREAQTSVIVKDGQTVVIGGLMKDDRSVDRSKVPIFGDIPLLGALFRRSDALKEKTELLVFITPRVILTPDEARNMTVQKEAAVKDARVPHRVDSLADYKEGRRLYGKKRYQEAVEKLQSAAENSPDDDLKEKAERLLAKARKRAAKQKK
jgi:general secretion pathway protein D